jgi:dolichyl-phosphate-mannose--protein O-mannosyl transferase
VYLLSFAPFILAGHTWEQFIELHRQMWYYHTGLVATHSYQSTPLQWIFNIRPVWYWVNYEGATLSNIYAIGNPLILWLGLVALILQVRKIFSYPTSLFYLLYFVFTLPWIFSPRIMFFYHYLPSSVFLCVILANWLSSLPHRTRSGLIAICVISLIIISPMIFGFPVSQKYWSILFAVFPSWK